MKFHEHISLLDRAKLNGNPECSNRDLFYMNTRLRNRKESRNPERMAGIDHLCCAERDWYESGRPYYKLWPSIMPAFLRIPFTVPNSAISLPGSITSIVIRLSEKNQNDVPGLQTLLISVTRRDAGTQFTVFVHATEHKNDWMQFSGILLRNGETIEDSLDQWNHPPSLRKENGELISWACSENAIKTDEYLLMCFRIGIALCLLAGDPSIIQPDVLSKDRDRFDSSTDPVERQRLVDKARKRGIVGFRVGEQYESIPHYRRPHPALFHTGKGRTVPRIVFRSGCVVHRDKMTKVPTGYITPEGVEVEP